MNGDPDMKVAILSTVNLKHMTLVSLYTDYFDANNIEYDIIYIDKYGDEEKNHAKNVYKYNLQIDRSWGMIKKGIHYIKFKPFAQKILVSNKYDFIITWNALTAFMFSTFLAKHYTKKYCVNIRDITESNLGILKHIIEFGQNIAIKNSCFTTVSSAGFIKYLPQNNYIFIQSLNMSVLKQCISHERMKEKDEPINITYIGYMCYYDNCIKLIDALRNDRRFVLNFFGQGSEVIADYALKNGIANVSCVGRFQVEDTARLIQDSDIIFNLYGNDNINLKTALSIKLYYAIYLRVPILVCENTYMKEIADSLGIGITIGNNQYDGDLGNYIFNRYHDIEFNNIKKTCDEYRISVEKGNDELTRRLDEILG